MNELATSFGVEISGLGYYPNPLCPDRKEAKVYSNHIKKVIRASALLGVDRMNTFIGRDWTKSVDENWAPFRRVWKPIIALAEKQGVKVDDPPDSLPPARTGPGAWLPSRSGCWRMAAFSKRAK